jgi:hypothetical protein
MKHFYLLLPFFLLLGSAAAQKTAYELLDQRLGDLQKETEQIEDERNQLAQKVRDLQRDIKYWRENSTYYKKQIERSERELTQAIKDLYDTQNMLMVKIGDVALLTQQVGVLQSEKDSLSTQLGNLASTDAFLRKQLDSAKVQIQQVKTEYDEFRERAKMESLEDSFRYPRGYRPKRFSVFIPEAGLVNVAGGFTVNLSSYTYLIPSRSLLGGFGAGLDFYDRSYQSNPGSFFIVPVTGTFRGNFGAQDFFTLGRDTSALAFNISWILDLGWGFVVKDTEEARSYGSNVVMSGGVGTLWPFHRNFGMGASAQLKVQRLRRMYSGGSSGAELLPMLILKVSFYLRK